MKTREAPPPDADDESEQRYDRAERAQRREIPIDSRAERVMPALGRTAQVEQAVRLENATGQTAVDMTGRIGAISAAQAGGGAQANLMGGESGTQNLPSQSAPIDDDRFSGRVVRGLTAMMNQRGGTMLMRLDPPELGQLRVQMTIARGVVSAQFTASTPQAHALLEKNMAVLRTALENQGLTVERLNVQTQSSSTNQHQLQDDGSQRGDQQSRHDASGGQSRGRRDGQSPQTEQRSFARMTETAFQELVDEAASDEPQDRPAPGGPSPAETSVR